MWGWHVFCLLMQADIEMTDTAIFKDTSETINGALKKHMQLTTAKQTLPKQLLKTRLNN